MINLAETLIKFKTKDKDKKFKPAGLRVSDIGSPCTRYIVHSYLDWDKRPSISENLSMLFNEGKEHEDILVRDLAAIRSGFYGAQDAVSWDEFGLVGHPDGKIYFNGDNKEFAVVEIKSTNEWTFNKLNTPIDFLDTSDLTRKWYDQLQVYMLLLNTTHGLFLLKDRTWGGIKQIEVELDLDLAETILKKAKTAWEHCKAKTYPEKINDLIICGKCPFAAICLPDLKARPKNILADEAMANLLEDRERYQEAAEKYKSACDAIKAGLPDIEGEMICGNFQIISKQVSVKGRVQEVKPFSYFKRSIERIPDVVMETI